MLLIFEDKIAKHLWKVFKNYNFRRTRKQGAFNAVSLNELLMRKYAFKELNKMFLQRKQRKLAQEENSFHIAICCKTIQGFRGSPFKCQLPQTRANVEKFFETYEKFEGTVKVSILCDAYTRVYATHECIARARDVILGYLRVISSLSAPISPRQTNMRTCRRICEK